jgi:hypothetical protein
MSSLSNALKKFGGANLLKQYISSGTLFYVLAAFLITGKDKTSLELVRMGQRNKVKKKLAKKYKNLIAKPLEENETTEVSNKVWFNWFQGLENAPEIVKVCYASVQKNLPDKEIVLLTDENISDFVEFPEFILEKRKRGLISNAHFSDLLRLELLITHGGTWIDSTVLLTSDKLPSAFFESDLFFFQKLKPGKDGHALRMSSWFINAKKGNATLKRVQECLYKYWAKNDKLIDYFLIHVFMDTILDEHLGVANNIPPFDSGAPHSLLLRINDTYDKKMFENIKEASSVHKLSYKDIDKNTKDTYYNAIKTK